MDDNSIMAFGLNRGRKLGDISTSYLEWLMEKENFSKSILSYDIELKQYITKRKEAKNDTTGTT